MQIPGDHFILRRERPTSLVHMDPMLEASEETGNAVTNQRPTSTNRPESPDTTSTRRIPLNIFGMGFGLAGLATAWRIAVDQHLAPHEVSDVLIGLAAVVWLVSVLIYLRYVMTTRGALTSDLHDMTVGPFASLALITPILLAADGIAPYSRSGAAVIIDVFIIGVVLLGSWFTGTWMRGGTELDRLHPGYVLPTVAGGLVASAGAAVVGQQRLAEFMLGLGILCWIIVGSMILGRVIFRPTLPDALFPTMAIEVAPAAVASLAYFFSHGAHITAFVTGLAGYGLLMVVAQIPLLSRYVRLKFSLATWAFTFSWAAVASTLLFWIAAEHVTGGRVFSYLVLAAISILVAAIAARTVVAISQGRLLPPPTSPAAARLPATNVSESEVLVAAT
jgi:tellurite resistance protein